MTREELFRLAAECSRETALKNRDLIDAKVQEAFCPNPESPMISHSNAIAQATGLALTLAPDLAAATTMRILIELGLVTPDPEAAE